MNPTSTIRQGRFQAAQRSSMARHVDINQRKIPPKSRSTLLAILSNLREHSIRARMRKGASV